MRLLRSQRWASEPSLSIDVAPAANGTEVRIAGELDLASVPQLRTCLADLTQRGEKHLVLDLSGVTFCDSTALGLFVGAHRRCEVSGGSIEFRSLPSSLRHLLRVSGLDQILDVD
ncbi:MAG: STAS domain-containing protein [Actinobacteria bacterium]|nr:STAS domain-containing protein [Actinomycetota bacterium]